MKMVTILSVVRKVESVDKRATIKQIKGLAGKDTKFPLVIYGPECCGKAAFLRQASEVLREHGHAVIHINPLAEAVIKERFSGGEYGR